MPPEENIAGAVRERERRGDREKRRKELRADLLPEKATRTVPAGTHGLGTICLFIARQRAYHRGSGLGRRAARPRRELTDATKRERDN